MICFSFLFGFIQLGSFRLFVVPCCDCIVAQIAADRQHIVPMLLENNTKR